MMKKQLLSTLLTLCIVLALLPATALAADTDLVIKNDELVEYNGSDKAVTIPDSVTGIGDAAFYQCTSLTSVTIPNSVTHIGWGAFSGCDHLTDVYYSGSESQWKKIKINDRNDPLTKASIHYNYNSDTTTTTTPTTPSKEDNVKWTFLNGNLNIQATGSIDELFTTTPPWDEYSAQIRSIWIRDGVTSIPNDAFAFYSSVTSVMIPTSVTKIGTRAFMGCSSLTDVTIPNSINTLDEGVFLWCSRLTKVTIPDSVAIIEASAFMNCNSLTDVYYGGSEAQWKQIYIGAYNDPLTNAVIHYGTTDSDAPSAPSTPPTPSTPPAPSAPSTPSAPATDAMLSPQKLTVDGESVDCEKYNIGGSNYFKLRDLAYLLNGTGSQFGVGFDAATSTVSISTGEAYTPTGTELATSVDNSSSAQPSSQSILIDGAKHSELTVYNIGGSNFFQLRELGGLLGFEVDYDAASNTAIVRSKQNEAPDRTEDPNQAPAPAAALANGKAITDENIREIIYDLKNDYPEGVPWTKDSSYMSPALLTLSYGGEGFALLCSDAAFGKLPVSSEHSDFDRIRVGDLLRLNYGNHAVIVLEKRQDSVIVAEGNYNNSSVHWDREISRQSLEEGNFTVCSRYPAG